MQKLKTELKNLQHSSCTMALTNSATFTKKCWLFAINNAEGPGTKRYIFWNYIRGCTYVPSFKFLVQVIPPPQDEPLKSPTRLGLTKKDTERRQWHQSVIAFVKFQQISHFAVVFKNDTQWYTYTFSRPSTPLSIYVKNLSTPFILDVQTTPSSTFSSKLRKNNHTMHLNGRNRNKNKTKSLYIQIGHVFYCLI